MEEVRAIGEVAVVQEELHLLLVLVLVEVLDAARVERLELRRMMPWTV